MPANFEMKVVLQQLAYTGTLETIKIRKLGFPIRYKFAYFVNRSGLIYIEEFGKDKKPCLFSGWLVA
jgi:myosin heavy subunit